MVLIWTSQKPSPSSSLAYSPIVDSEVDVDGIDLVDLGENGLLPRAYHIARVFQAPVDATIKRGGHLGVFQVQPGQIASRFRRHQGRPCRIAAVFLQVHISVPVSENAGWRSALATPIWAHWAAARASAIRSGRFPR
jgi:hypothetical protein